MAVFLKALPQARSVAVEAPARAPDAAARELLGRGEKLYARHCADCHGERGEGAPGAYPPLAGNRAVTMDVPANIVRIVLHGGFPPATAGNPRPYGMPPFLHVLDDADIAAVASLHPRRLGQRRAGGVGAGRAALALRAAGRRRGPGAAGSARGARRAARARRSPARIARAARRGPAGACVNMRRPPPPPLRPAMVQAFALLLVFQLAGEVAAQALGLPVPGPLVGMLLLFAALLALGAPARAAAQDAPAACCAT